jgi:hypothetical protein
MFKFKKCRDLGRLLIVPFKGTYTIDYIINDSYYHGTRDYEGEGCKFREEIHIDKKDFKKLGIKIKGRINENDSQISVKD